MADSRDPDLAAPERWEGLSTATVSDCMARFGAMRGVRRLSGGRLVGPAYPVQTMAGENSTLHRAIQTAPAGSVLVVDAAAAEDRAVWGEVMTVAAIHGQLRGLVLDGVTRDLDAISGHNFPLFARGTCPAGPHKGWSGRLGTRISCGGVVVEADDVVIGDGDGVVVVPHGDAQAVLVAARDRVRDEAEWMARISAGEPSTTVLGIALEE